MQVGLRKNYVGTRGEVFRAVRPMIGHATPFSRRSRVVATPPTDGRSKSSSSNKSQGHKRRQRRQKGRQTIHGGWQKP